MSQISPTYEGDYTLQHSPFPLLAGGSLPEVTLRYTIYGALNEARDNAILVPHALSGSARVADWWPQLFGTEAVFDLTQDCIIGINMIGSCYGSTGPTSLNPTSGKPYNKDFPVVAVKDNVRAQVELIQQLGIQKLRAVIGGSIGGMQAMQWAIDFPTMVAHIVAVGAAPLSALALALNHLQRQAILDSPQSGLALARQIAMISYKSPELFAERYGRRPNRNGEDPHRSFEGRYDVGGYLHYQGDIFTRRFVPDAYLTITKLMDNFELGIGYESVQVALGRIIARVLLIGIESDWLFPVTDVEAIGEQMKAANVKVEFARLITTHGHDGFLAEPEQLVPLIRNFIRPEVR